MPDPWTPPSSAVMGARWREPISGSEYECRPDASPWRQFVEWPAEGGAKIGVPSKWPGWVQVYGHTKQGHLNYPFRVGEHRFGCF